jgi:hypothetical protein
MVLAINQVQKKLLGMTFRALVHNHESRVEKSKKKLLAVGYSNLSNTRKLFKIWKQKYFSVSSIRSAQELAKYMESSKFKFEYFRKWKQKQMIVQSNADGMIAAAEYHGKLVKRRYMLQWLEWFQKLVALHYRFADYEQEHEISLLLRIFAAWKSSASDMILLRQKVHETHHRLELYVKVISFRKWFKKLQVLMELKEKEDVAVTHSRRRALQRILMAWKSSLLDYDLARMYQLRKSSTRNMKNWISWMYKQRAKKLEIYLNPGRQHHELVLLRKALLAFKSNAAQMKEEKEYLSKAVHFHSSSQMRNCFRRWWFQFRSSSKTRKMYLFASEFHLESALRRNWNQWISSLDSKFGYVRKMNAAARYNRQELLRSGLNQFIAYACYKSKKRLRQHFAKIHHTEVLQWKYFSKWEGSYQLKLVLEDMEDRANEFRHYCNYKVIWNRWCRAIVHRKQAVIRWNLTEAHHERVILQKHFSAFLEYVRNINSFRREIRGFHGRQRIHLAVRFFDKWRDYKNHIELIQIDSRLFYEGIEAMNVKSIFFCWKTKTGECFSKQKELEKILLKYCSEKEWCLIENCYHNWNHKLTVARKKVKQSGVANRVAFQKIARSIMSHWRKKFKHRKWLQINQQLAYGLFSKKTLGVHFCQWFSQCSDWKALYAKNHLLPKRHYKKILLSSVMGSWKMLWNDSKDLKTKLGKMEAWRQQQMIRFTVGKWFHLEQEQLFEFQRNSGLSTRHIYLGCKYGRRWRIKTLQRLEAKGRVGKYKPTATAMSVLPLTAPHRQRPSPRKPAFIFDSDTNRFRRLEEGVSQACLAEPFVEKVEQPKSLQLDRVMKGSHGSLPFTIDHVMKVRQPLQNDVRVPKESITVISSSCQTDKSIEDTTSVAANITSRSVGTQYELQSCAEMSKKRENDTGTETSLQKEHFVASKLDFDFAKRLYEIQCIHKTFLQKKEQLANVEEQLLTYTDSLNSYQSTTDLESLLHSRKTLLIEIQDFESNQSDLKDELITIRSHIASLMNGYRRN